MRRSGVSGLCHRPDEAVASNRATRRSPVDRLVFLTATCPSLHLLRTDAGPGRGARLSTNPVIVSFTYGDMRHFCIRMLSRSHRRRRYEIGERCGGAPVRWARDGSWARSRRGGRLRGSGGGGSGRPRPCRPSRSLRPSSEKSVAFAGLQADRGPCAPLLGEVGDAARDLVRLDPRARLLEVRARGLSDVLAGRGTFSRVTRRARGPGRAGTTGPGTGAGSATALGRGGRFRDGASRARVGSDPGLHGGAHPAPRHARQGLQGPACVMRAQCDRIHPTSRRASSA